MDPSWVFRAFLVTAACLRVAACVEGPWLALAVLILAVDVSRSAVQRCPNGLRVLGPVLLWYGGAASRHARAALDRGARGCMHLVLPRGLWLGSPVA